MVVQMCTCNAMPIELKFMVWKNFIIHALYLNYHKCHMHVGHDRSMWGEAKLGRLEL